MLIISIEGSQTSSDKEAFLEPERFLGERLLFAKV